jgi:phage tail tape-measure protein
MADIKRKDADRNPDPITGAPGSHPVGTGVGAAGAGAAGAAIGAMAGPVGAVAGAAIGAVVGGLAGKGVAEAIDPTVESAYWRENYTSRPYYDANTTYDEYEPAYRYGWESRARHQGKRWEDVETDLGRSWDTTRGNSRLEWERAKHATRDAWHRVERAIPGDADRDGR